MVKTQIKMVSFHVFDKVDYGLQLQKPAVNIFSTAVAIGMMFQIWTTLITFFGFSWICRLSMNVEDVFSSTFVQIKHG